MVMHVYLPSCIIATSNLGNHITLVYERNDIVLVSEREKERDSKIYAKKRKGACGLQL